MDEPNYVFDPNNWESTYEWGDRGYLEEEAEMIPGKIKRLGTLLEGPPKYLAYVVLSLDDEGDPDECEYQWFNTLDEAEAATKG